MWKTPPSQTPQKRAFEVVQKPLCTYTPEVETGHLDKTATSFHKRDLRT